MCDDSDYGSDSGSSLDFSHSYDSPTVADIVEDVFEDDFDSRVRNTTSYSTPKGTRPMTNTTLFDRMSNAGAGTHGSTLDFSKAQSMETAQRIDFGKDNPGVTNIRAELYWESEHDGDVAAVILGSDGNALPGLLPTNLQKGKSSGTKYQPTRGLVWYNNYDVPGVSHSGDVTSSTDGDDTVPEETIKFQLNNLEAEAEAVLIVASTYPAKDDPAKKPVSFGKLRQCIVLIINDDTNEVLYTYELDEDFSAHTSVELTKFYKRNGDWRLTNMSKGVGKSAEALGDIAAKYGVRG